MNVVTANCPQAGEDLGERCDDQVLCVSELRGEGRGSRHGPGTGHVILTARLVEEGFPPLTVLENKTLVAVKWGAAGESLEWSPPGGKSTVNIETENIDLHNNRVFTLSWGEARR